jgi:adenine-specific DNA methylase
MTATSCPRCGRVIMPLDEIAPLATAVDEHRVRLRRAFDRMRLAIPVDLVRALQALDATTPRLAESLACHSGRCTPRAGAEP